MASSKSVQPRRLGPEEDEADPSGVQTTVTTRLLRADSESDSGRWTGVDDFEGLPWWRKPSVLWLLGPFSLFTLAFGGTIVPKLNLVLDLVCRRYYADQSTLLAVGVDNPMCRTPEVQKDVATFLLVINLVTGGLSAIVAPKLGHLSDRHGRRKLLALASCGGLLGEIITVLAAKFPDTVDYRWLVLGAFFDGMTGSFTAGSILSQSYTSDCTPPSRRAVSIGYIQACLFMGLAFGPLLSGYFVKWTGSLLSMFYVAICCHAFFVLFAGFVMPESLSKKRQIAAREKWKRAQEALGTAGVFSWLSVVKKSNPFIPLRMLWPTGWGTSTRLRLNLLALAICDAIFLGVAFAVGPVLMLYAESMFHWGNFETSRFVSILSLTRVFVLMGLLPLINYIGRVRPAARRQKLFGTAPVEKNAGADGLDIWLLRFALIFEVIACVGYTLARDENSFVASGLVTALGGLGSATTQAAVTKHMPPELVGQMLGAIGMLHALSRIVGPVVFSGLYAATVKTFPQAVFLALGGLFAFALVITLVIRPHVHWHESVEEQPRPQPRGLYSTIVQSLPVDEDQVRLQ
ncbi:Major facilitator superfamily domain, general substrate transporter [Ophiocordyceps camponoti-floridani]|uniref:Major facilitator superfamily domain, general substrate transporter n=1 Tax=Ophiocordyceps camponoti-floridani TaxID=2030778 RepID=A0A8H4Q667_9HYPO|nr:Major facilitator superfamily domain, general substrate transporter [Ophiocordyceps camponoti-floridani]